MKTMIEAATCSGSFLLLRYVSQFFLVPTRGMATSEIVTDMAKAVRGYHTGNISDPHDLTNTVYD